MKLIARPGFKTIILLLWILITADIIYAQQKVYYRASDGKIITPKQLDSIITVKNKKLIPMGFHLQKMINARSVSGDSVIYNFTLSASNKASIDNAKRYTAFIGKPLPAIFARDINNQTVDSKKLKGRPLIINMWFTTCAPCINEMPQLNLIRHDPRNSNVRFIAITFDSKLKVKRFLTKRRFDFIQLAGQPDYCKQFTDDYPISIFVNKAGVITDITGGLPLIYDTKQKAFSNRVDASDFNTALANIR